MEYSGIRRLLLLLVCYMTGLLGLIILSGWGQGVNMNHFFLFAAKTSDFRFPDSLQDVDTVQLISLLRQKLKDLNDSGFLDQMGQKATCKKGQLSNCIDPNCNGSLPSRFSPENIESVRKPVREVGMDKLREVMKAFDVTSERKKYVFVTGTSSNHFQESEGSLQSLHRNVFPHLTNYSFIFYDLGLNDTQRKLVRDFSGAELKTFPFDKLPARFKNLHCYLWKPLIVLAHLLTSEFLIWMDSSVYYETDILPYFNNVTKTGVLINRHNFPFAQHVYLKMFSYFGDEACQFSTYREVEAGFLVLHNEPFTRHLIIEPWAACALDPGCMCPALTIPMRTCGSIQKYGKCHRYDQSTIGYILIKLLRESRESVFVKRKLHSVRRGLRGSYFSEKAKQKKIVSNVSTTG